MTTAETIYAEYPRKVGRQAALKAIRRAMRDHDPEWLLARVRLFAASPDGQAGQYTPHPATWFNAGRYDDDDREWFRRGDKPLPPMLEACRTPLMIARALSDGLANRVNGKPVFVVAAREAEITLIIDGKRVTLDQTDCSQIRLTKET